MAGYLSVYKAVPPFSEICWTFVNYAFQDVFLEPTANPFPAAQILRFIFYEFADFSSGIFYFPPNHQL